MYEAICDAAVVLMMIFAWSAIALIVVGYCLLAVDFGSRTMRRAWPWLLVSAIISGSGALVSGAILLCHHMLEGLPQ